MAALDAGTAVGLLEKFEELNDEDMDDDFSPNELGMGPRGTMLSLDKSKVPRGQIMAGPLFTRPASSGEPADAGFIFGKASTSKPDMTRKITSSTLTQANTHTTSKADGTELSHNIPEMGHEALKVTTTMVPLNDTSVTESESEFQMSDSINEADVASPVKSRSSGSGHEKVEEQPKPDHNVTKLIGSTNTTHNSEPPATLQTLLENNCTEDFNHLEESTSRPPPPPQSPKPVCNPPEEGGPEEAAFQHPQYSPSHEEGDMGATSSVKLSGQARLVAQTTEIGQNIPFRCNTNVGPDHGSRMGRPRDEQSRNGKAKSGLHRVSQSHSLVRVRKCGHPDVNRGSSPRDQLSSKQLLELCLKQVVADEELAEFRKHTLMIEQQTHAEDKLKFKEVLEWYDAQLQRLRSKELEARKAAKKLQNLEIFVKGMNADLSRLQTDNQTLKSQSAELNRSSQTCLSISRTQAVLWKVVYRLKNDNFSHVVRQNENLKTELDGTAAELRREKEQVQKLELLMMATNSGYEQFEKTLSTTEINLRHDIESLRKEFQSRPESVVCPARLDECLGAIQKLSSSTPNVETILLEMERIWGPWKAG